MSSQNKTLKAKDFFNKFAEQHKNLSEERLMQYELNHFISLIAKEQAQILDAGCAAGRDAKYLTDYGLNVTGIDISEELIKKASERKIKNAAFKLGDISIVKLDESQFDGVWAMDILSYTEKENIRTILKNLNSSIKKGGVLFLSVREGNGLNSVKYSNMEDSEVNINFFSISELEDALQKAGFCVLKSYTREGKNHEWINIFAQK
ncbi:class I SAM-dependent methyltransferase [Candidatus Woesearchaeota archaeon]|nr:class I SAM-dependent methyltransferase [Candidatus Woesearchaeota archaeon]